MQKKIYSWFLVPCLALSLVFGFLVSCGDDTGSDPGNNIPTPRSSSSYTPPQGNNNPKVNFYEKIGTSFYGKVLRVTGKVKVEGDGSDQTVIRKIDITLNNTTTGAAVNIPLSDTEFGNDYDLTYGQPDGFNTAASCDYSKGRFQIYVAVYLSTNNTTTPDKVESLEEEYVKEGDDVPDECKDFEIKTSVSPAGSGTVTLNPSKSSYRKGETVTITASPIGTYTFQNWSENGWIDPVSGTQNPRTITVDANKDLTAVFFEAITLVRDDNLSKNYTAGQDVGGYVQFTGTDWLAQGSNTIVEWFQKEDGTFDQIGHDPERNGPLPSTQNAANFTPKEGRCAGAPCDAEEIGYTVNYYFLVKTTASGGWRTWYLMHGANCTGVPVGTKCTAVTVWKAQ